MINTSLHNVCTALDDWCKNNNVVYDIVCDESDLQGVMLFKTNKINSLIRYLKPTMSEEGIHIRKMKVRGGSILAFSLEALSESYVDKLITKIGAELLPMSFKNRIEDAFINTPVHNKIEETEKPQALNVEQLYETAKRIVAEDQFKDPTISKSASSATSSLKKSAINPLIHMDIDKGGNTGGDDEDEDDESMGEDQYKDGTRRRRMGLRRSSVNATENESAEKFDKALNEALDGMATPTDDQPGALFDKFAKAISALASELQIDVKGMLKQQGIKAKESDDGLRIILYTISADTNAPVPIHQIDSGLLTDKHQFGEKLKEVIDLAKGQAPGTDKQKQEIMRNQDTAVKDVADAIVPDEEYESPLEQNLKNDLENDMQPILSTDTEE